MKNLQYALLCPLFLILMSGCKKEDKNIFNMFTDVEVIYHNNSPYSVTGYKRVNEGDSIYIDVTLKSAKEDMYYICLHPSNAASATIKNEINESGRREFSYTFKMKATAAGKMNYRVYPLDRLGVYLGDNYKSVTVDVLPNYTFMNERLLMDPDTVGKVKDCYLSLTTGETFSYSEGKSNEDKIDLGVYSQMVFEQNVWVRKFYVYSLDADPLPFTAYDISTWNKRKTLFSTVTVSGAAKFETFKTGLAITAAANAVNINQSGPVWIKAGDLLYFKTKEGKVGAIYVFGLTLNSHSLGHHLNFQIKYVN